MFATGFMVLAACLLAQVIVGDDVWNRSAWRRYFFPGFGFVMGLAMWGVAVLASGSTIHLLAHFTWAQVMMLAGGAYLGLARGKLQHRSWRLTMPLALGVSGLAFLGHGRRPFPARRGVPAALPLLPARVRLADRAAAPERTAGARRRRARRDASPLAPPAGAVDLGKSAMSARATRASAARHAAG